MSASQAAKLLQDSVSLHDHVSKFLENGGQDEIRKVLQLPPGIYYNPLQFLEREDLPHRGSGGRHSSDLEVLHALGMDVPGIDTISSFGQRTTDRDGCNPDSSPTVVWGTKSQIAIFYSPSTPHFARIPVQNSVRKWADVFDSSVRIRICFKWSSLGQLTLGATSSLFVAAGEAFDKLIPDTLYSPALASALQGVDVLPSSSFHLSMTLNAKISWHVDENTRAPAKKFDLATTVLHELTHGLFFTGTIKADSETKKASFTNSFAGRFDQFMKVGSVGVGVARTCKNQSELYRAVTNPSLRFVSGSTEFGLYAPRVFEPGSSMYHLNNETLKSDCEKNNIRPNDCSDLMTHQLEDGYTQRVIAETTLRIYRALRGKGGGVPKGKNCILPDVPVESTSGASTNANSEGTAFVLPTWGIATVAVIAGVGAILVFGVVVSSVTSRR